MSEAFICDAIRTPFGRYGGALSSIRTDDLAALPLKALMARNPKVEWGALEDVILGCANQAGEDNRNVARMALLLAGLPIDADLPGRGVEYPQPEGDLGELLMKRIERERVSGRELPGPRSRSREPVTAGNGPLR